MATLKTTQTPLFLLVMARIRRRSCFFFPSLFFNAVWYTGRLASARWEFNARPYLNDTTLFQRLAKDGNSLSLLLRPPRRQVLAIFQANRSPKSRQSFRQFQIISPVRFRPRPTRQMIYGLLYSYLTVSIKLFNYCRAMLLLFPHVYRIYSGITSISRNIVTNCYNM